MDDGRCCDSMNLCLAHDPGHGAAFRPILKLSNSTRGGRGKREVKVLVQGEWKERQKVVAPLWKMISQSFHQKWVKTSNAWFSEGLHGSQERRR